MESIAFDIENKSVFFENSIFFKRYQIGGIFVMALIHYLSCLVFRNRSMFLDM